MPVRYRIRIFIAALLAVLLLPACSAGDSPSPTPSNFSLLEQQGFDLFTIHCAPCHALEPDTIIVGPPLAGIAAQAGTRVAGQNSEAYLRNSLLNPNDFLLPGFPEAMPPDFGKRLSGQEFDAIIAFLLTLK